MLNNVNIDLDGNALMDSLRAMSEPVAKMIVDAGTDSVKAGVMSNGILAWILGAMMLLLLGVIIYLTIKDEFDYVMTTTIPFVFVLICFIFAIYGYIGYKYSPTYKATCNSIEIIRTLK